jgi:hypothetical protein
MLLATTPGIRMSDSLANTKKYQLQRLPGRTPSDTQFSK